MRLAKFKNLFWRWRLRNEAPMPGFDPVAYLQLNADVAMFGVDPWVHYLRFGRAEHRDPNPEFSATGYLYLYPEAADWSDPWLHYQEKGCEAGLETLPELQGGRNFNREWPTLMLVGHQADAQLYGAERSLVDLAEAFAQFDLNLIVVLPSAINVDYVGQLRPLCYSLAILPYGWWRRGREPVLATVHHFERLMCKYHVDAVYANTLVLDEPLRAAKNQGLPCAVHVRELPEHDPALCEIMGASPMDIAERVRDSADLLVANSVYTAESLSLNEALVVPNCINVENFVDVFGSNDRGEPLAVGMISSNLPKKGLDDFVALAQLVAKSEPQLKFKLIGPINQHINRLKVRQGRGELPANLEFLGYFETVQQALAELDIVVNLSHFQESFGRSILEAMAAGRPVIAYNWGALPELVQDGKNGYLVPLGNVGAIAEKIALLARAPGLAKDLGSFGREIARNRFSFNAYKEALDQVLTKLI